MDSAGFVLAQTLRQQMSPVVMVLRTPKVEESCKKNLLSFVDLCRPFCSLGNINVPVRTASDQPYRLSEFYIRMFYSSDICRPLTEAAEQFLVEVINDRDAEVSGQVDADETNADPLKMITEAHSRITSFQHYTREFMRTLSFSEHEAVDHPIACILVASSSDENPVIKFGDLYNSDQLPALFNEGVIDPKLLKLYVLLHDNQEGPADRANEILLDMKSAFGVSNCRILSINSTSSDPHEPAYYSNEDLWESHLFRPMTPVDVLETDKLAASGENERRGCYISKRDMGELAEFVLDLSVKHIIPCMEVKIRTLYHQVSATRKGLKNQLKNLWWRKGKDDVPDASNGPSYTFNSMESQIRVLADFAFMLRDYELALSNYRLLSSDYKTDKAWKRYAGVQEMIGLSLFMLDQSRRESELCMETAINYYQKVGPSGAAYVIRSALWLAEMHKAKLQYKEAAVVLFRASAEEASIRAGLLLEQAAYCYLHTTPPMLRKYGFQLVLAGNQYSMCFQRKLATHAYRNALSVFGLHVWNYIDDHIHFHLGRLSTLLGNHASAVQFFKKVIASGHQSSSNQVKFLSEFLFVIQSTGVQGNVLELDLPMIDVEHVHVRFEDRRTYNSSVAASVPEKTWSLLEDGLVPGVDKIVSTWLDTKAMVVKTDPDFNICVAGEEIGVDVEFSNPLQIQLDVTSVSLICSFTSDNSNVELGEDGTPLSGRLRDGVEQQDHTDESELSVSKENFSLKAGEKIVIGLKVKPLQAGTLLIGGVKWILSEIATGQRDFVVLGPKSKNPRTKKRDEPPPHRRLKFHVLGHMPRLDVSLHGIPGRVNTGEVRRLVLELSNPSSGTLKAMKLKTSHPLFLLVGDPRDLDKEFPGCLEVHSEQSSLPGIHDVVNVEKECTSGFIFSFPEGTSLEGGSTLLWPLWLHAREAGTISLNTVIYYEPEKLITGLLYRTVRISHDLQVLPSLKVSAQITPSPVQLQQFLLRLDIENKHSSESFWLRQVSCSGNQWSLSPLPPPIVEIFGESEGTESVGVRAAFLSASVCPSQLLPASQTSSLFFKLLNVASGEVPSLDEVTSNIKLGPPSSTEPLIDVATGPLCRFLFREKLDQPMPALPPFLQQQIDLSKKVHRRSRLEMPSMENVLPPSVGNVLPGEGTVHITLISEQQDGMITEKRVASLQDSVRVVVHDICHCSVRGPLPLAWVMEGPRYVRHDFSKDPFCEVPFLLKVRNCSIFDACISVETFDMKPIASSSSTSMQDKSAGWFPLVSFASGELSTLENGAGRVSPGVPVVTECEKFGIISSGPFMWCDLRSANIPILTPGGLVEFGLCVAFFSPGIYDLSRYRISWTLVEGPSTKVKNDAAGRKKLLGPQRPNKDTGATFASGFSPISKEVLGLNASTGARSFSNMSGVGLGHPLLLTVLQGM